MTTEISPQAISTIRLSIEKLSSILLSFEATQKEANQLYDALLLANKTDDDTSPFYDELLSVEIVKDSVYEASRDIASAIDNLEHINL